MRAESSLESPAPKPQEGASPTEQNSDRRDPSSGGGSPLHWVFDAWSWAADDAEPAWLSAGERERLAGFRFAKRRRAWLLVRRTAKRVLTQALLQRYGGSPTLAALEIAADPSGAPFARLAPEAPPFRDMAPGARLPLSVSISHSHGAAFCAALWTGPYAEAVGADLERIEPRPATLLRDFFTEDEIAASADRQDREVFVNSVWSAKEAVLKALRRGLTVDTRSVSCLPDGSGGPSSGGWRPFGVRCSPDLLDSPAEIAGLWQVRDGFILTLAVLAAEAGRCRPSPPRVFR